MQPRSRFNRDFELLANDVLIRPPLRVSFEASKAAGSGGLNRMVLRVYNLTERHRLDLAKDAEDSSKRMPISFRVGYEGVLQLLFKGTVHRGQNYREGADLITELECLDGGFDYLNSFTSKTVRGKALAIDEVLADMPGTGKGKITTQEALIRPRVLVGASGRLLKELTDPTDATWFIDDEKLYVVKDSEVLSNFIPVVSAETGLINTPTREQSKITFSTLLNPTLRIANLCQLVSRTAPYMNGIYRIDAISFKGDTYGADWSQDVTGILAPEYTVL